MSTVISQELKSLVAHIDRFSKYLPDSNKMGLLLYCYKIHRRNLHHLITEELEGSFNKMRSARIIENIKSTDETLFIYLLLKNELSWYLKEDDFKDLNERIDSDLNLNLLDEQTSLPV